MATIGLIGVGFVGKLFVDALAEEDRDVVAYDVDDSQIAYAVDRGATAASSPAEVGQRADAVVLSVPGAPEVAAALEDEGLLAALSPDDLLIDTSTTGPEIAERFADECARRDVRFVTAPLTRAAPEPGIHFMVGGTADDYRAATPVLETLGSAHVRIGDPGDAQRFKLMIQLRYAGHEAVDAEAVAFGREHDLDVELAVEYLGMDLAEGYFSGDHEGIEGMGGLGIWRKDVGYALDVARESNAPVPLASLVHEAFKYGVRAARADESAATAIERYWER